MFSPPAGADVPTRADVSTVKNLFREDDLSPYSQTSWRFCDPDTFVSGVTVIIAPTEKSEGAETIRYLNFKCKATDGSRENWMGLENSLVLGTDYRVLGATCPDQFNAPGLPTQVTGLKPTLARNSAIRNLGYARIQISCNDVTGFKGMTDSIGNYFMTGSEVRCPSGSAVCGGSVSVAGEGAYFDPAISGMSFACCKLPSQ
jgi:hypothetical protein